MGWDGMGCPLPGCWGGHKAGMEMGSIEPGNWGMGFVGRRCKMERFCVLVDMERLVTALVKVLFVFHVVGLRQWILGIGRAHLLVALSSCEDEEKPLRFYLLGHSILRQCKFGPVEKVSHKACVSIETSAFL